MVKFDLEPPPCLPEGLGVGRMLLGGIQRMEH